MVRCTTNESLQRTHLCAASSGVRRTGAEAMVRCTMSRARATALGAPRISTRAICATTPRARDQPTRAEVPLDSRVTVYVGRRGALGLQTNQSEPHMNWAEPRFRKSGVLEV